jgi:hypothetical protein
MKLPSRKLTVTGILLAVAGIFVDPTTAPALVAILGAGAGSKIAAIGAILAGLGRALVPPSDTSE